MAFVVEDGTGLTTATSLVSEATTLAYWADRGDSVGFAATTQAKRQAALIKATDYIRNQARYRWRGTKKSFAQTQPWPRTGAYERDGQAVPSTSVPWQVAEATCYLAGRFLTEALSADLPHGGAIVSESVGPISVTYAGRGLTPAGAYTVLPVVDGLLAPLLRTTLDPFTPYQIDGTVDDAFVAGAFDNGTQ